MNSIQAWLIRNWRWYRHRVMFVIADPTDNSITLSKALCNHMDVMNLEQAKVFVFKAEGDYAFILNPNLEVETQLADIQYNDKHRCIGFESLCPTVNRIFFDYNLPPFDKVKLSVDTRTAGERRYYAILKP